MERGSGSFFSRKGVLLGIVVILVAIAGNLPADDSSWTMVGFDAAHTGFNRFESALMPPFPVEVEYQVGPGIQGLSASEGILYATCRSDTAELKALDIATGDTLWTFQIPYAHGATSNTPAILDTLVYVGAQSGTHLYCLDGRTGIPVWSYPTGSLYTRHATVDEGRVYVNAGDSLLCLDAYEGSLVWGRISSNSVVPAIKGDSLYVSTRSDSLIALDKATGALLWGSPIPVTRGVIVAGDSLLYLRSSDTDIKALRLSDGSEKWSRTFSGEMIADIDRGSLAFASHALYVSIWTDADAHGKVYALDGDDGAILWDYTFGMQGALTPVVAHSVVYVGNFGTWTIYAFDASTGDTIATIPGQNYQYIVSEGSLITRGASSEVHLFRMEPLGIGEHEARGPRLPGIASLSQNYPNPFNPATEIRYRLGEASSRVKLSVHDMRGHLIRTLVDREQNAGEYTVTWNGRSQRGEVQPSGIYFSVLEVRGRSGKAIASRKRKMILLK